MQNTVNARATVTWSYAEMTLSRGAVITWFLAPVGASILALAVAILIPFFGINTAQHTTFGFALYAYLMLASLIVPAYALACIGAIWGLDKRVDCPEFNRASNRLLVFATLALVLLLSINRPFGDLMTSHGLMLYGSVLLMCAAGCFVWTRVVRGIVQIKYRSSQC